MVIMYLYAKSLYDTGYKNLIVVYLEHADE